MRGRFVALAGVGIATALACGSSSGFACQEDSDCVLAGVPGVCQPDGNCSYPDPDCPSGFRYPTGASDDVAGECVPGDAASTGTTGGTMTSSDSVSMSAGTISTTNSGTGTSVSGTLGMTTDDSMTDSGTGSIPPCNPDLNEGQDPIEIAPDGCMSVPEQPISASLADGGDRDEYFLLFGQSCGGELIPSVHLNTDFEMRACLFLACFPVAPVEIVCLDGAPSVSDEGLDGCCSGVVQHPSVQVENPCADAFDAVIYVDSGPSFCANYTLSYGDIVPPEI